MEKIVNFRVVAAGLGVSIGALGLSACGQEAEILYDVPGVVASHEYDDPDTWTTIIPAGRVMVPVVQYDPEHFYLNVEQCGHDEFKPESKDGCGVISVEVDAGTYHTFKDGDQIVFSNNS